MRNRHQVPGFCKRVRLFDPDVEHVDGAACLSGQHHGSGFGDVTRSARTINGERRVDTLFHAPRHDNISLFRGQNRVSREVTVGVTTLDQVLPDLARRFSAKGIYLKLDTQGHDLEALKGAGQVLAQVAALQTEATVVPIYEGAPTYQEMIAYLLERGFAMSGIFPNNSGHFPRLIEFDCYMISEAHLAGAAH